MGLKGNEMGDARCTVKLWLLIGIAAPGQGGCARFILQCSIYLGGRCAFTSPGLFTIAQPAPAGRFAKGRGSMLGRGMDAFGTSSLRGRMARIWRLVRAVWRTAGQTHLGLIAAGVAFFGMFGIFPGLAAMIAIFGMMADPAAIAEQLALMADIIPADAYRLLAVQVDALVAAPAQRLGWASGLSVALALWASRAAVGALIGGLNAITGDAPRNSIGQALLALALTLALVVLGVVAVNVIVILPLVMAFLSLDLLTAVVLDLLRWCVALAVLLAALGLLYRFGPVRAQRVRGWISLGAVVVVVLWVIASAGLSYYLANFGSYNEIYGSLGVVIGMMLWLYISAYLILLGAALDMHLAQDAIRPLTGPEASGGDI